jgi:hypothetical protein
MDPKFKKARIRLLTAIVLIVPLGFLTKFYQGPGMKWVQDSLGGVLYVVFWCLAAAWFFPKAKAGTLAVTVLLGTCLLEILQLGHPPFLEWIRSYFLGRILIGTTFTWLDFPHYILGWGIGWILIERVRK